MQVSKVMITALVVASAGSAFAADADNGQRIARRWCAECHVVAPNQRQGSAVVPWFAGRAARPGFTARRLAFFLLDPHPKMPNLFLTRAEVQDIAAYIAGLR
jgi:mono/diheme cytochrome c family protein